MSEFKFGLKIASVAICLFFSGCTNSQTRQGTRQDYHVLPPERFIEMNRQFVEEEQSIIARYVEQENLNMKVTQTGLWYNIRAVGAGPPITAGNVVTLDYKVWLLDGTLCYSSDELGHKVFKVGQGGVESGLEEGILKLRENSQATFIMPPHLAHGHLGDDNKIPYRAIIKYEVTVLDVNSN